MKNYGVDVRTCEVIIRHMRFRPGDEVEITVADSGAGIPDSIQPRVFEPFFTTKPKGSGTGLGLSTVQMVVDRHEGRLEFSSEEGVGTTFKLFLRAHQKQPGGETSE